MLFTRCLSCLAIFPLLRSYHWKRNCRHAIFSEWEESALAGSLGEAASWLIWRFKRLLVQYLKFWENQIWSLNSTFMWCAHYGDLLWFLLLLPSLNIYHLLVYFYTKNNKYLRTEGVLISWFMIVVLSDISIFIWLCVSRCSTVSVEGLKCSLYRKR
jgi:hypothetical protein